MTTDTLLRGRAGLGGARSAQHSRRPRAEVAVVAWVFTVIMMGGTLPTPLYPTYAEALGLSSLLVTVIFAGYPVGVLVALLLGGHLSDQVGRRPVLAAAVGFAAAGGGVFLLPPTLPSMLAARILGGIAVGLVTGTATADLTERAGQGRGSGYATAANMGGLGLGPALAGPLVQYAPAPTTLPYIAFLALLVPGIAVLAITNTTTPTGKSLRLRPQRLGVPASIRVQFTAAAAASVAAFALLGLLTALAGQFTTTILSHDSPLAAGLTVVALFGAVTLAQLGATRLTPRRATTGGLTLLPIGLALVTAALPSTSLALLALGAIVGGTGVGLTFKASLTSITAGAPAEQRGQVTSSFFTVAYLGLTVPVLTTGLLTDLLGLTTASTALAAFVTILTGIAFVITTRLTHQKSTVPAPDQ